MSQDIIYTAHFLELFFIIIKYLCVQTMFIQLYEKKIQRFLFLNAFSSLLGVNTRLKMKGLRGFSIAKEMK